MDYMNEGELILTYTYDDIYIDGIPIKKWVGVVIRVTSQNIVDVYINGNLTKRHKLSNIVKQNYDNLYVNYNGGFSGNISNLKTTFNKTLQRAMALYDKLDAAKSQSSLNDDAKSHPSIQSLNLKEKSDTSCEEFQTMNETIFNSLTEKHDDNKVEFSTIDSIIDQINEQIKKIKNKL